MTRLNCAAHQGELAAEAVILPASESKVAVRDPAYIVLFLTQGYYRA